jgi:ATP-independent RNA helicase DbpA
MGEKKRSTDKILFNLGIEKLNDLQEEAILAIETGKSVITLAPTGSGKTLAFMLPLLKDLNNATNSHTLIITPTRELSLQIEKVYKSTGNKAIHSCCYGGHAVKTEKNELLANPALIIGTPGRIHDHIRRGNLNPRTIQKVVLDEFDKSLELGFQTDMEEIIRSIGIIRQTILTSATRLKEFPDFLNLEDPLTIDHLKSAAELDIKHYFVRSQENDKLEELYKLLCHVKQSKSIIFCNHREAVERISDHLKRKGIAHAAYHGGLDQESRERALIKFRNNSHYTLIATDLASRGLDIEAIENVVHYQLANSEENWIHRDGRTARMFASGTSWVIMNEKEYLPDFIKDKAEEKTLPEEVQLPQLPEMVTLYLGAGKKDKVNKVDIVGFVLKNSSLNKDELGIIDVRDHFSYAAIKRSKSDLVVKELKDQRIKRKKVKIAISR